MSTPFHLQALLATLYPDDDSRGAAMGQATAGVALGVLLGPPFGGVVFHYGGRALPFLIITGVAVVAGLCQFFWFQIYGKQAFSTQSSGKTAAISAGSVDQHCLFML